jgi:osmotically-inducible protein OsmY
MTRRLASSKLKRVSSSAAVLVNAMLMLGGTFSIAAQSDAQPANDTEITGQVVAALSRIDPQQARRLQVTTRDGVVTLTGPVSPGVAVQALNAVKGVQGVVKVRNNMSITQ